MSLTGIGLVWEERANGSNNNGGGFVWLNLVSLTYKWTASGGGTDEYFVELSGGGDPGLTEAKDVYLDGKYNKATKGTVGSLNVNEWDYGDNDAKGFSTVYVRLANGTDPDSMGAYFVGMGKGGGVDYSQQDSAVLSASDFSSDVAGTTITTAGGGVTALMVGNIIYISNGGTGGSIGWYEIASYISGTQFTIDRSCGSSATGMTGAIAGARNVPLDAFYEQMLPGHQIFSKSDGAYIYTQNVTLNRDGTAYIHIQREGYNSTRGDDPTGTDRPLQACGSYYFAADNYWTSKNYRATGTGTYVYRQDDESAFINCKADNSSVTANRSAFHVSGSFAGSHFIDCEGISTNGYAFNMSYGNAAFCYAHDSTYGYYPASGVSSSLQNCIMDTCTNGVRGIGAKSLSLINCMLYGNTNGILFSGGSSMKNPIVVNCIFDNNTNAIVAPTSRFNNAFIDYNNYTNNTTDITNYFKGRNATALDAGLNNPGAGDFTPGDNMKGIAYVGNAQGSSTSSIDLGAIQIEEVAAGGGGSKFSYIS
jgi:hypothetical protein